MERLDLKEGELGRLLSATDRQILRTIRGPLLWSLESLAQETGLSETAIHLSCDRLENLGLLRGFDQLPTAFPMKCRSKR